MSEQTRVGLFVAANFAASATAIAFLPLAFADRGLTAGEIGQVLGLASLLRIVAVPLWGRAADAFGRRRLLLAAALVAVASALVLVGTRGFLPILLIVAVHGIAASAIGPLTDALTLALAGAGRLEYGRARAWGSVSYMLATAATGPLLNWAGTRVVPLLLAGWYALAVLVSPLLPDAAAAPSQATRLPAATRSPASARPMSGAGLLRNRAFRLGLLASALVQGSHGAYYAFAALHWRSAGYSDTVIGLLLAEGIVVEIALFIWGRRLVERLGPARLVALAASCAVVRWTGTALLVHPAALAALQLLHAGTFASQHLATMQVLQRSVRPGRAGTAQAVMSALGASAPTGAATWLSGQLYAQAGGLAFLTMAVMGGMGLLLVPALGRALPRKRAAGMA